MEIFDYREFANIKAKAEVFFQSIVKMRCPALVADVHFSSDGFHHLKFNGVRVERTKAVQKTKMLCLQEAAEIIKKTTTIQEFRSVFQPVGKTDNRQTRQVEYYAFHAITDLTKPRRINVVVRRIGEGNYHFWSVMPSWKESRGKKSRIVREIGGGWMLDS